MLVHFIVVIGIILLQAQALDVSWIPSDPDGPLPLSHRYRESLSALCGQIASGAALPPEIQEKRKVLDNMCSKLSASEGVSESVSDDSQNAYIFVGLIICGIIYLGRSTVTQWYSGKARGISTGPVPKCSDTQMREAREARVRKFQMQQESGGKVD